MKSYTTLTSYDWLFLEIVRPDRRAVISPIWESFTNVESTGTAVFRICQRSNPSFSEETRRTPTYSPSWMIVPILLSYRGDYRTE